MKTRQNNGDRAGLFAFGPRAGRRPITDASRRVAERRLACAIWVSAIAFAYACDESSSPSDDSPLPGDALRGHSALDAAPPAADASSSDAGLDEESELVSMTRMANALARVFACTASWPSRGVPPGITFRETYASQFPCMEEATTCTELLACDSLREEGRREWPRVGDCDDDGEGTCDGDLWRVCFNGSLYEVDCGVIDGLTCGPDSRGIPECVPLGDPCDPAESGCRGNVARVCTSSGVFVEYDCSAFDAGFCLDCNQSSPHCEAARARDPSYAHATCRLPSVGCERHLDCPVDQVCTPELSCASRWCDPDASRDPCPAGYACTTDHVCLRAE